MTARKVRAYGKECLAWFIAVGWIVVIVLLIIVAIP